MVNSIVCPICGGSTLLYQSGTTTGQKYFTASASYGIAGGDYKERLPIWRCRQCGHGVTDHGVTPAIISDWYARHSLDTVFLSDEVGRRRTAGQVLQRIGVATGKKGRLLDVGAGPGLFASEAKRRGWQVEGIEPSASSRAYTTEHFQLSLHAGGVERLRTLPAQAYDVVTLCDVIEHVIDPAAALRLVSRVLAPGGLLVITTPKFDSLLARLLGTRWYSIFPAHLHFFTRRSLELALSAGGFQVSAVRHHVRHLSIGYLWQRLVGWVGGRELQARTAKHGVLKLILPVALGDEFEIYARKK